MSKAIENLQAALERAMAGLKSGDSRTWRRR
jgi:hypothetical protein